MNEQNGLKNLKHYGKNILIWGLGAALAALILSLVQPFEYQATMRFVISQRQFGFNQDAYAAAKSAEKLATNIADTITSKAFLMDVLSAGFGVDRANFPQDEAEMRKVWEKKISAETAANSGMLTIKIYDTDKNRATQIAEAVTYVLNTKGADYHGGSRDVSIKRIDDPLVSKWPARPNLPVNVAGGLILGILAGGVFYFLRGEVKIKAEMEDRSEKEDKQKNNDNDKHDGGSNDSGNGENAEERKFKAEALKLAVEDLLRKEEKRFLVPENVGQILPVGEVVKDKTENENQNQTKSNILVKNLPKTWLFED